MAKGAFVRPDEKRKVLEIYARSPSMRSKEVHAKLEKELLPQGKRVLSLRSVQGVLRESRTMSASSEDQEWGLHLMPTLGFPTLLLPVLTRLSRMQERAGSALTCRDAKWAVHVKSAAPELQDKDVLSIATQYSFEEWLYGRIGDRLWTNDDPMVCFLDKLVTYQPWASDQNRREFVSAIPDKIPFPSESLTWATWAYCLGAPAPEGFTFDIESAHQVASMPPPPLHDTKEWFWDMKMIWGACCTDTSPAG